MLYKGIKTLEVLEGADNYNNWIASAIKQYVKSPALEIGAGTGNISEYFRNVSKLVLTDNDPELVAFLDQRFRENKNISCETLDVSQKLGSIKNKFQSIYAINVLEHIKDDQRALSNMNLLLEKGGKIAILVPAKKIAFTKLDKSLGHFRRYEKNELRKKIEEANFEVEKIEFFNVLGLLSWFVRDKVSKNDQHLNKNQVKLFDAIVPFLKMVEPKTNLPFGISLIAVAQKR